MKNGINAHDQFGWRTTTVGENKNKLKYYLNSRQIQNEGNYTRILMVVYMLNHLNWNFKMFIFQ